MALKAKVIDRMGKVEDRSTISDYDPEEQARAISINTALVPLEYNNTKINVLEHPGISTL
jgi:elongation factor G